MPKKNKINLDGAPIQAPLFSKNRKTTGDWFPPIGRTLEEFKAVLYNTQERLGIDYEFNIEGPTKNVAKIIGIANRDKIACIPATPEIVDETIQHCLDKNIKLVGHSVIGAEMVVTERTCGIKTPVEAWSDTILKHFLLNMDLTKAAGKKEDEGGLGFNNLWSSTSLVLDVPQWKDHRSRECDGEICPRCDVYGYCGVDSWSSLELDYQYDQLFKDAGIPMSTYENLLQISYIAEQMGKQGIKIDTRWVETLERRADEIKDELFPYTKEGKTRVYQEFNPRSSDQVIKWFKDNGIDLASTEKKEIRKKLEKTAGNYGYQLKDVDGNFSLEVLEQADELKPELDALYRLYTYKDSGKGLAPWFAPKYLDKDDFIYPRFITIGASTTRWSSSRPNFTNVPARGFGALARAAIIPDDASLSWCKSDESQLELRVCLYLSGVDPSIIGADAFKWLVSQADGKFDDAAKKYAMTARDIAKSISHGGDYLESFKLFAPHELQQSNTKRLIERGALKVYLKKYGAPFDWEYCGKIVAFTGINVAERIFGSKSDENRAKALEIQEGIYFAKFPMIREWQKKVLDYVQDNKCVCYPTGHMLRLYGQSEDNAKMAVAALGQGTASQYMQGLIKKCVAQGVIPKIFCHDEIDVCLPWSLSDKKVGEFFEFMSSEIPELPGFRGAYKAIRGNSWLEGGKNTPEELKEKAMWPLKI